MDSPLAKVQESIPKRASVSHRKHRDGRAAVNMNWQHRQGEDDCCIFSCATGQGTRSDNEKGRSQGKQSIVFASIFTLSLRRFLVLHFVLCGNSSIGQKAQHSLVEDERMVLFVCFCFCFVFDQIRITPGGTTLDKLLSCISVLAQCWLFFFPRGFGLLRRHFTRKIKMLTTLLSLGCGIWTF